MKSYLQAKALFDPCDEQKVWKSFLEKVLANFGFLRIFSQAYLLIRWTSNTSHIIAATRFFSTCTPSSSFSSLPPKCPRADMVSPSRQGAETVVVPQDDSSFTSTSDESSVSSRTRKRKPVAVSKPKKKRKGGVAKPKEVAKKVVLPVQAEATLVNIRLSATPSKNNGKAGVVSIPSELSPEDGLAHKLTRAVLKRVVRRSLSAMGIEVSSISTDFLRVVYRCSTADVYVDDVNLQTLLNKKLKSRLAVDNDKFFGGKDGGLVIGEIDKTLIRTVDIFVLVQLSPRIMHLVKQRPVVGMKIDLLPDSTLSSSGGSLEVSEHECLKSRIFDFGSMLSDGGFKLGRFSRTVSVSVVKLGVVAARKELGGGVASAEDIIISLASRSSQTTKFKPLCGSTLDLNNSKCVKRETVEGGDRIVVTATVASMKVPNPTDSNNDDINGHLLHAIGRDTNSTASASSPVAPVALSLTPPDDDGGNENGVGSSRTSILAGVVTSESLSSRNRRQASQSRPVNTQRAVLDLYNNPAVGNCLYHAFPSSGISPIVALLTAYDFEGENDFGFASLLTEEVRGRLAGICGGPIGREKFPPISNSKQPPQAAPKATSGIPNMFGELIELKVKELKQQQQQQKGASEQGKGSQGPTAASTPSSTRVQLIGSNGTILTANVPDDSVTVGAILRKAITSLTKGQSAFCGTPGPNMERAIEVKDKHAVLFLSSWGDIVKRTWGSLGAGVNPSIRITERSEEKEDEQAELPSFE